MKYFSLAKSSLTLLTYLLSAVAEREGGGEISQLNAMTSSVSSISRELFTYTETVNGVVETVTDCE